MFSDHADHDDGDGSDSDGFAHVPSRDSDDDDVPGEQTDPERRLARKAAEHDDAATGRYDLGSLADFDDLNLDLPSAHVSEFDVSDLDGDIESHGAPTAIMQLPPSMLAHRASAPAPVVEDIPLRKWSAGPPGPKVAAPAHEELASDDRGEMAATLPALSLAAVRAAAAAAGVEAWPQPHLADEAPSLPMPLPPAPPSMSRPSSAPPAPVPPQRLPVTATDVLSSRARVLRAALDDALAAVTAAQACADAGHVPPGLHGHLDRAVELLSRALDIADDEPL